MSLTIKEISKKKDIIEFIRFPDRLYSGNKFYVPALHAKELNTLSFDKNPAFEFCRAKYWLAVQDGVTVGRIAGIINDRYNEKHKVKYARFGWLDFVDDKKVLILLFQAVRKWAISQKMEYIHGPLGFSSFDFSGVLIKGFDELPTSFARYNFTYYPKLIEELGYTKDIDWVEYNVKVPMSVPEKFIVGAELVKKRYNIHSAILKSKKDILKYSDEIFKLLNDEYKDVYCFSELSKKQIESLKRQFASILNPDYVSIILDASDKVIAFGITMPSLSIVQQELEGKLFPFGFFRIRQALRKNDTADALLIAVRKNYQNHGVHGLIFTDIMGSFIKNGIINLESTRELESNVSINNVWNKFEYRQHKRTRCYIKKL